MSQILPTFPLNHPIAQQSRKVHKVSRKRPEKDVCRLGRLFDIFGPPCLTDGEEPSLAQMTNRCRLSFPLSPHLGRVWRKFPETPRTNNSASTASSLNVRFSSSSAAKRTVVFDRRPHDRFNMPVVLSKVCRATKGWNPLLFSSLSPAVAPTGIREISRRANWPSRFTRFIDNWSQERARGALYDARKNAKYLLYFILTLALASNTSTSISSFRAR